MKTLHSVRELKNIKGIHVLVRVDFNVPIQKNKIQDSFRIDCALPTITTLARKGAKVILISHLGEGVDSLLPVAKYLQKLLPHVLYNDHVIGEKVLHDVEQMKNGDILLLGNLRQEAGEVSCNKDFAKSLASLADIYVQDAFPVSHRKHASVVLLPKLLPSYTGMQLEKEVTHLQKITKQPKHPVLAILSGAKFSTKLPLIKKYLTLADHVVVGGALLNTLLQARGYEIGQSLTDTTTDVSKIVKNKKLIVPEEVIVVDETNKKRATHISGITSTDTIVDIAPSFITTTLTPYIMSAKTIVCNGPLGKYESGYADGTKKLLQILAQTRAYTVIGGGDTVALISKLKCEDDFNFVSSGGGATIDFLATGTLPGIQALMR